MTDPNLFYDPSELKIFEYYNGEKIVAVDPYDLMLSIASIDDFDWELAFGMFVKQEVGEATPKDAGEAARMTQGLIEKLRGVFGIVPLERCPDGSHIGLGGSQVLQILMSWHTFLSDLKKKEDDLPTLPPNTDAGGSDAN